MRQVIDGTGTAGFSMYSMIQSHYDKDADGRVTKSEFTSAMLGFTCCGGNAPFSCWCEEEAYRVFPPVDSAYCTHTAAQTLWTLYPVPCTMYPVPCTHTAAQTLWTSQALLFSHESTVGALRVKTIAST